MILAIDVGNTNTVLGCIDDGNISAVIRIRTDAAETPVGYAIKLKQIFEFYNIDYKNFEGTIISSVVPQITNNLKEAVFELTGIKSLVVGPGMKTGMNVRLEDPSSLAGDLAVGSVAAIQYYGAPVIVVDLGTATTVVLIDKDNCFRGGAIMSGVSLSLEALANGTSLLPDISLSAPKKVIATNTADSMRSGAVFGTAAMLDGMIERMEKEIGYPCKHVATGGTAKSIVGFCNHDIICDENLLLKGLWYLYKKNS